jgi:hypothetical protein
VITSPPNPSAKILKQSDMDSSVHRLSRVPQKFTANRAVQQEKQEQFAVSYFRTNPDARDTTPPDRKLELLEEKLKGDLDDSERFSALMQQKAIRYIVYGELSPDALRSHAKIGSYYLRLSRRQSAIRHLAHAQDLEKEVVIEESEKLNIAIDLGEAYMMRMSDKKAENAKNSKEAARAVEPYKETEIEDARLRYRRDVILARISAATGNYQQAIGQYQTAWESLEAASGTENVEGAQLYIELGDSFAKLKKNKSAADNYQQAYAVYLALDLPDEAQKLESKLPKGDEQDEEPQPEEMDLDSFGLGHEAKPEPAPEPEAPAKKEAPQRKPAPEPQKRPNEAPSEEPGGESPADGGGPPNAPEEVARRFSEEEEQQPNEDDGEAGGDGAEGQDEAQEQEQDEDQEQEQDEDQEQEQGDDQEAEQDGNDGDQAGWGDDDHEDDGSGFDGF